MKLEGRKAVVTGGAMGIGLETSRRLLKEGVDVAIWDMNQTAIDEAEKELHGLKGKLYRFLCDVSHKDQVFKLAEETRKQLGGVDILVNNAGIVRSGSFCDQPIEDAIKLTEVNLNAVYYTTYAFLPEMLDRNFGNVVNLSSSAGLVGVPDLAVYCATKSAVTGFTETLALEAHRDKKTGVHFSVIYPHFIKTGLFEGSGLNLIGNFVVPRVKDHDVIAKAIVEKAVKKNRMSVKRPMSMQVGLIGRALFPASIGAAILRATGIGGGMKHWIGTHKHD